MFVKGQVKTVDEARDITKKNRATLHQIIKDQKNNINLTFLDATKHSILTVYDMSNTILVVYRNGMYDLVPAGLSGTTIKEYLGIRFNRIKYWAVLPFFEQLKKPKEDKQNGCKDVFSE